MHLNAASCLTKAVLHHRFHLQQENSTKTEYRKTDPNRSWAVNADSHAFLICIGRAEIKHVFGWCPDLLSCKLESYSHKAFLQNTLLLS